MTNNEEKYLTMLIISIKALQQVPQGIELKFDTNGTEQNLTVEKLVQNLKLHLEMIENETN